MTCDRRDSCHHFPLMDVSQIPLMNVSQISPLHLPQNPSRKKRWKSLSQAFRMRSCLSGRIHSGICSTYLSFLPALLPHFVPLSPLLHILHWILIPLSDSVWSASLCFYVNLSVLHSQVWRLEIKLKSCALPDLFTDYFVVQIPLVSWPWKYL